MTYALAWKSPALMPLALDGRRGSRICPGRVEPGALLIRNPNNFILQMLMDFAQNRIEGNFCQRFLPVACRPRARSFSSIQSFS
jgi:hypothetical protein